MAPLDPVELTKRLIAFDTVNPPGSEADIANFIAEVLETAGFSLARYAFAPDRVTLVARKGRADAGPALCLSGHLDTVPLGAARWQHDPFGAEVSGGRLYGRGSSDMKSGVAAMVVAAVSMAQDLEDGPGVVMVFTAGEETGCEGAAYLMTHAGATGAVGALVIGEPTGNQPLVGHKGALWVKAQSHGKMAHGSMPELGVNAIYKGMSMVAKLQDFGFNIAPHPYLGSPTINVGQVKGGMNINSVPDLAEIGVDIRTVPGLAHPSLLEQLRSYLAPDLDRLEAVVDLGSVWTSTQDPWLARTARRLGKDWIASEPAGVPFFTDASVLKPGLGEPPTLILGPGETNLAHQTDEYCFIDRIPEAVAIYRDIIADWQSQTIQPDASKAGAEPVA